MGTHTASIKTVKLLINSTLSTPNANFACIDIENFYLGMPLDHPEYAKIKLSVIPHKFINEYNLTTFETNGWVHFQIQKDMYGLKQVGKLANHLL